MSEKILNTLKYKKDLESVGVPSRQAEKQIEIMGKIINSHLATKDEIGNGMLLMRYDFEKKISDLRSEMATEFKAVRNEMATEFKAVRKEISELGQNLESKMLKYVSISIAVNGLFITILGSVLSIIVYLK
ncbi:MAG: DUF1640 domain-containing protein [Bdellovibrionales bacterium]|nr:DUF1640 domain-containing protein [Bdellovibrionales bacterium]